MGNSSNASDQSRGASGAGPVQHPMRYDEDIDNVEVIIDTDWKNSWLLRTYKTSLQDNRLLHDNFQHT